MAKKFVDAILTKEFLCGTVAGAFIMGGVIAWYLSTSQAQWQLSDPAAPHLYLGGYMTEEACQTGQAQDIQYLENRIRTDEDLYRTAVDGTDMATDLPPAPWLTTARLPAGGGRRCQGVV